MLKVKRVNGRQDRPTLPRHDRPGGFEPAIANDPAPQRFPGDEFHGEAIAQAVAFVQHEEDFRREYAGLIRPLLHKPLRALVQCAEELLATGKQLQDDWSCPAPLGKIEPPGCSGRPGRERL